jgi:hypothetical protein
MDKIKNLILATPAKIVAICSVAFLVALWLFVNSLNYMKWSAESEVYARWQRTDAVNICKTAASKCSEELREKYINSPNHFWLYSPEYNQCINSIIGNLQCQMYEPPTLESRISSSSRFEDYAIAFAIPFAIFYAIQFFLLIKHVGWKRIILTTGVVVSAITVYKNNGGYYSKDEWELFSYGLIAFLSVISLPFVAIHFVKWIREGFTDKEEAKQMLNNFLVDKSEIVYYQPTRQFWIGLAKVFGVFLLILVVIQFQPEKTAQAVVKGGIQGAIIGAVFYFYDRWKKK